MNYDYKKTTEQLKKALEFAKSNPDHPDSQELRRRMEAGQLNFELKALGKEPVPLKKKKLDLSGIKWQQAQPEKTVANPLTGEMKTNGGNMSSMNAQPKGSVVTAKNAVAESLDDLGNAFVGTGTAIAEEIVPGTLETLSAPLDPNKSTKDSMEGVKKTLSGLGNAVGGFALNTIAALPGVTPEVEQSVADLFSDAGTSAAESDVGQSLVQWWDTLDEDVQLSLSTNFAAAEVALDLLTFRGASRFSDAFISAIRKSKPTLATAMKQANEFKLVSETAQNQLKQANDALGQKIQAAFDKGVKPSLQGMKTPGEARKYQADVQTAAKVISQNKDNLTFRDSLTGEEIVGRSPQNLTEFRDAIEQTKSAVYQNYNNLAEQAGENGLKVDMTPIANRLDELIENDAIKISNPDAIRYAQDLQSRLIKSGELDATVAQEVIQNYNNSLASFYRNPTPDGLTKAATDAFMVNNMRQALDEGIEGISGAQYQALKNQYASLKTIERDVLRATLRDARKNNASLIDFTDIFTIGQLAGAIANPADAVGAAASFGWKSWYKYLNNPNVQVQKMFKYADELPDDPTIVPISSRKQLPAPKPDAPDTENYVPIELPSRTQSTVDAAEQARIQELIKNNPEASAAAAAGAYFYFEDDGELVPLVAGAALMTGKVKPKEILKQIDARRAEVRADIYLAKQKGEPTAKISRLQKTDDELRRYRNEVVAAERNSAKKAKSATTKTTDLLEEARKSSDLIRGETILQNNGSEMEFVGKMNTPKGEMFAFRTKGQPEGSFELFPVDEINELLAKQGDLQLRKTELEKRIVDEKNVAKNTQEQREKNQLVKKEKEANVDSFLNTLPTTEKLNAQKQLKKLVRYNGEVIPVYQQLDIFTAKPGATIKQMTETIGRNKGKKIPVLVAEDGTLLSLDNKGMQLYAEEILKN